MEKIQARIIIEILGRPAEHIKEALNILVVKLGSEKGVKILEKQVHDPRTVEDAKDLYTTFAEVNFEVESIAHLFAVLFAYMPANVEVIYPEEIKIPNQDFNSITSALLERLHNYDAVSKRIIFESDLFAEKLKETSPEAFARLTAPAVPQVKVTEIKQKQKKSKSKKSKK